MRSMMRGARPNPFGRVILQHVYQSWPRRIDPPQDRARLRKPHFPMVGAMPTEVADRQLFPRR